MNCVGRLHSSLTREFVPAETVHFVAGEAQVAVFRDHVGVALRVGGAVDEVVLRAEACPKRPGDELPGRPAGHPPDFPPERDPPRPRYPARRVPPRSSGAALSTGDDHHRGRVRTPGPWGFPPPFCGRDTANIVNVPLLSSLGDFVRLSSWTEQRLNCEVRCSEPGESTRSSDPCPTAVRWVRSPVTLRDACAGMPGGQQVRVVADPTQIWQTWRGSPSRCCLCRIPRGPDALAAGEHFRVPLHR